MGTNAADCCSVYEAPGVTKSPSSVCDRRGGTGSGLPGCMTPISGLRSWRFFFFFFFFFTTQPNVGAARAGRGGIQAVSRYIADTIRTGLEGNIRVDFGDQPSSTIAIGSNESATLTAAADVGANVAAGVESYTTGLAAAGLCWGPEGLYSLILSSVALSTSTAKTMVSSPVRASDIQTVSTRP